MEEPGNLPYLIAQCFKFVTFLYDFVFSLFAARAGASRVIAVEASAKMAAVASQV